MSMNNRKRRGRNIIVAVSCGLLIFISLITFQQQIPSVSQTTKIYDREYISALRHIREVIPQNATLATSENYPQVAYFTDHKVEVPWVKSERALVQFMWKNNCSYLLVPEDTSEPPADNTPLLIQLAEKPFERIFDYYAEDTSEPPADNTPLRLHKIIKENSFEKLFEKILDYNTEGSILHLYHLRSNITRDNLNIVTDNIRPTLFVSYPVNGTIMEAKFGVLRVNVTGIAMDADSNIKKVEVSVDGLPFKLANPRAPGDWSTWSFSDIATSEGTKIIVVRAMDNADNKRWFPLNITIR
jgi:hypothetical protein